MKNEGNVKKLKTFRWPPKLLRELRKESKRSNTPQIRILEIAFGHFMNQKANQRDKIKAA